MSKPSFQTINKIVSVHPSKVQATILFRALSNAWMCLPEDEKEHLIDDVRLSAIQIENAGVNSSVVSEQRRAG